MNVCLTIALMALSTAQAKEAPATAADIVTFATVAADENSVRLTVSPQSAPVPSLRYSLLPPMSERRPGNAAILYHKAGINFDSQPLDAFYEKFDAWLNEPNERMPKDELRTLLDTYRTVLETVELAARREQCDWQFPLGEQNLMTLLLPEVQLCRTYARLLQLKARLQIAEGKLDDALRTLQCSFALARHVSEGPTLINALVGQAIVGVTFATLQEFIQAPGAPNLYWALSRLPRPMIDLRRAIEVEMAFVYLSYPRLNDVENSTRTAAEWDATLNDLFEILALGSTNKLQAAGERLALGLRGYPIAKQRLIDRGTPRDQVEQMPVAQVLLIEVLHTYDELRDEIFCWALLPYAEAAPFMLKADQRLIEQGRQREIIPLASMLLPAINASRSAMVRGDRNLAALRNVEAIRLHAAAHEGRLPAQLSDIVDVPVAVDPVNGQAFAYRVDGDTATLSVTKSITPVDIGFPYIIRLKP